MRTSSIFRNPHWHDIVGPYTTAATTNTSSLPLVPVEASQAMPSEPPTSSNLPSTVFACRFLPSISARRFLSVLPSLLAQPLLA